MNHNEKFQVCHIMADYSTQQTRDILVNSLSDSPTYLLSNRRHHYAVQSNSEQQLLTSAVWWEFGFFHAWELCPLLPVHVCAGIPYHHMTVTWLKYTLSSYDCHMIKIYDCVYSLQKNYTILGINTNQSPLLVSLWRGMFQPANFPLDLEERVWWWLFSYWSVLHKCSKSNAWSTSAQQLKNTIR